MREESDTMGTMTVPADRYWGAQTARSLQNFRISTEKMPAALIKALGVQKKSAALVNMQFGIMPSEIGQAIVRAADEVIAGTLIEDFPLVVWQTGSGTQSNMNANEVIANRAHVNTGNKIGEGEKTLTPNDDVNKSQSSNDTFPTGMHIACYQKIVQNTIPGVEQLRDTLQAKSEAFKDVVKIG
ncbi:MAG: class II fumarate hydratase, partial [Alphaproteobacteria bacterium]|nr:class II fumarate hydratase [Alphaproteobacteria bacterium]